MTPTTNARGGINRVSAREKSGTTPGTTGVPGTATFTPGVPVPPPAPVNRTSLTAIQNTPSVTDVPPPAPTTDFTDIITRYRPSDRPDAPSASLTLQDQLRQRNEASTALEANMGLDSMYSRSSEIDQQIADLTGSFGLAIQQEDGFVRPQEFITGRQAYLQNQKAAQIEALSAAQAAIDGKIALAEQRIEKAIEREFGPLEAQLAAAQEDYSRNKDAYDRIDKAKSEERAVMLQERERTLTAEKEERKGVMALAVSAAENGAPASAISRIIASKTQEEAFGYASQYVGALDRAAKYASIAASNTNRLLSLAEAGDPSAIAKLGFDPRSVVPEVDPTTKRQLSESINAQDGLLKLASEYKNIVDTAGYTNTIFGNTETLGKIDSLRALLTAQYKEAAALGTIDAGVLTLMDSILGEAPISTFNVASNATGRKSAKLSAQLQTFIDQTQATKSRDMLRLGINPQDASQVDLSVIDPETEAQIMSSFGVSQSTTTSFNPANFFNQ